MKRTVLALVLVGGLLSSPIGAQEKYPSRPVRLVIGSAPGGVHDIIGRLWADRVRGTFPSVLVETKSGVGGYLGAAEVAASKPDGYTLFVASTSTHVLVPAVVARQRFDPIKDFAPATIFAGSSISFVVTPSLPVRTLREFIDYAKAHPGKITMGTAGPGTLTHVGGELFKQLAGGLDIVAAHYKGAGPGLADVMSGHIPFFAPNVTGNVLQLHRAGKIRMLAVASSERLEAIPEIPTASEAGVPGMVARMFYAISAPAGTPRPMLDLINESTQEAMRDAAFRSSLSKAGFEPIVGMGPDQAAPYVVEEHRRWTPIVKSTGVKID